jgi:hypothetical protein
MIWNIERIHGLPEVSGSTFFSSVSRNRDTWWNKGTGDMWDSTDEEDGEDTRETTSKWDSMDDQDREDTMDSLKQTRHPRRVLGI